MTMFNQNGQFSNQNPDLYSNNGYRNSWGNQNIFMTRPTYQVLPGRVVNNSDDITPQEVPMDGSVSLFPQSDFSCIYAKQWGKDGTIQTVRYIPDQAQQANSPGSAADEQFNLINQRFDKIEKMLAGINRKPKRNNPHPKKEMNENE